MPTAAPTIGCSSCRPPRHPLHHPPSRIGGRTARPALLLSALVAAIAACTPKSSLEPATSGPVVPEREQDEILSAMRAVVPAGFTPVEIRTAPRPAEWRDVPAVVSATATQHEMAILRRTIEPATMRFDLQTLDDRPGSIEATLEADGSVRFGAVIGRFGSDAQLERSLVAMADALMRAGVGRASVAELLADPPFAPAPAE